MANALRALDALGLGPAVRRGEHAEAPDGIRDRHGRWLSRVDGAEMTRHLGTTALGVHRATLHRMAEPVPADVQPAVAVPAYSGAARNLVSTSTVPGV
ncbi:hypothetical protein [Micromonospora sp. U21]|uniref:hypothetical protein n=1 Tax=Micromonospora sp. U21 TaxID=2824899 RepID=UPI001FFC5487|nr:hypothetical protein [Micromonospora sp. U21]